MDIFKAGEILLRIILEEKMKINTKIRYSLRILYILAREKKILNTTELAKQGSLSPFYLRQIVIPLEKEGMLQSTRGIKGGYELARPGWLGSQ